jgi:hypothetical protein
VTGEMWRRVDQLAERLGTSRAVVVAGGVAVVVVALLLVRRLLRGRRGADPRAVLRRVSDRWTYAVGLAGMTVSMYGLFRFAHHVLKLPAALAAGWVAILDGATVGLVLGLYRAADDADGQWTPQMAWSRRSAWVLVAISAAANYREAPGGPSSKIFLALVPAVSAALIEHNLTLRRAEARAKGRDVAEDGARPGPARLVILAWRRLWAAVFARLGLDASLSAQQMSQAALTAQAATRLYELRIVLNEEKSSARKVARRRRRAQTALDAADVAVRQDQAAALARRMLLATTVDELAELDYRDPTKVGVYLVPTSPPEPAPTQKQTVIDLEAPAPAARPPASSSAASRSASSAVTATVPTPPRASGATTTAATPPASTAATDRVQAEVQRVLDLIREVGPGLTGKEVADRLGMAHRTAQRRLADAQALYEPGEEAGERAPERRLSLVDQRRT